MTGWNTPSKISCTMLPLPLLNFVVIDWRKPSIVVPLNGGGYRTLASEE